MIHSLKKTDPVQDSRSWIRENEFFITATALTVSLAVCSVYDAMNRVIPQENSQESSKQISPTQEHESSNPELERISGDIDSALGACSNPINALCIPSLLLSLSKNEECVTIDTLRHIARRTGPELSSPCCRVLDSIEQKPQLIAPTILIAKAKLARLSNSDWRKHVFSAPLHECEKVVLGTNVPVADAKQ